MEFCIYNPLWPSPNDPIAVAALFASSNGLHVTLAQLQVIYAKLYNSHKATITALNQRVSEAELRFDSIVKQNGMLIALLGRIRKDVSLHRFPKGFVSELG